jgi:hypothetical protein
MKHAVVRGLGVCLSVGLVISPALSAMAFSAAPQDRTARPVAGFAHTKFGRRSFRGENIDRLAQRSPARASRPDKAWLLEPATFSKLSSAGKRAALMMNGLIHVPTSAEGTGAREAVMPQAISPGDNIAVDNPTLDIDGHTHSETSIAVNGSNIVETFNAASLDKSTGYSVSMDGGNSFTAHYLPTLPGGFNLGDGVAAYGPAGELYCSQIAANSRLDIFTGVSKSTDNGATFSLPVNASTSATNAVDFQDKPWMTVDRNPSSPNKGNVYISWTDFIGGASPIFIQFARSTDAGVTFSSPQPLSATNNDREVSGSVPAVAPNGDLYVAYFLDNGNNSTNPLLPAGTITIVKSTDGGKTFGSPKTSTPFFTIAGDVTGGNGVRARSFPSMAVDKNGVVHIVYDAEAHLLAPDRSDVFYIRSTDGGNTFSTPVRINDDTTATTQLFPAVAAAGDGTIAIKWWDRRNDPINDSLNDVYMTYSTDGGATFGKNFRVTNANWVFGPVDLQTNASDYHGDYDGLAADGSNIYVPWSDERGGFPEAYFAFFPTNRDPNTPDFNISGTKVYGTTLAGGSAAFDFTTGAANGFTGNVNLSASANPATSGLTFNFTSASVAVGSPAHLTVSAAAGTAPGTYLITVAAAGPSFTRKTNVRLTVYDSSRIAGVPADITNTSGFTVSRSGVQPDQSGVQHLLFDDDTPVAAEGEEVFYSRSVDGGHTFSAPVLISTNSQVSFNSILTLDPAGNLYAVWGSFVIQDGTQRLFFSKSTDHGNSFSAPITMTPSAQVPDFPALAVDRNGNIVLSYVEFSGNVVRVFETRSADGGATFSSPAQVSTNSQQVEDEPSVAFDSKGGAYIGYNAFQAGLNSVFVAVASDGSHFNTTSMIPTSVDAFAPNITVDRSDNVYMTFYNRFEDPILGVNREVMVSRSCDAGNSFSPPVNVSNNDGQSVFPHIAADSRGILSVAWEDTTNNDQEDIFLARSSDGGVTFETPMNVSANSGFSQTAIVAVDNSGNLLISWTDDSPAQQDIFLATAPGLGAAASDFGLAFPATPQTLTRATSDTLTVFIRRLGGFTGTVTVNPPDVAALKIKLKGAGGNPQSTSCVSVSFNIKLKGGGPTGAQQINFTAQDSSGRTRTGVMTVVINPSQ